ncbi:MAG: class II SORL domain-containing protein [Kiritimatiellae bacterium]|nr:class II SORL domain-containing protein [Kiritimatiellia bacterium]MDD4024382.1 class II SORL domain-containing protein [Kiritimatiellia bacterium]
MLSEFVKTADWKSEKHVPVIECAGELKAGEASAVTISVGKEIPHPNTAAHHIAWIALHYVPEGAKTSVEITRCEFSSHGAGVDGPDKGAAHTESTVTVKAKFAASGTLYATAYCNIHGLWASEKKITVA